jgi:HAD superfamily hydrolase (TIGR01509 family)
MKLDLPTSRHGFAAYIFDCDGTIADTMPLHYLAWSRAMEKFGGCFPEELHYAWGGMPNHAIVAKLNEKFGLSLDADEVIGLKQKYYLEMVHMVRPIEPVVELARRFKNSAPIAIASGGRRELVMSTLGALELDTLFDVIVCAEDYEKGKPDPEPFLTAAARMGVAPQDCLVFEDTPTGVAAAKAAGMQYVLVPSRSFASVDLNH